MRYEGASVESSSISLRRTDDIRVFTLREPPSCMFDFRLDFAVITVPPLKRPSLKKCVQSLKFRCNLVYKLRYKL